jgi:hypothetical protein
MNDAVDDELTWVEEVKMERNKEHQVDLFPEELSHPHWKRCDLCGGRIYVKQVNAHVCEEE